MEPQTPSTKKSTGSHSKHDPLRFHEHFSHLRSTFGNGWFALKAEAFARFFGTPIFLGTQTVFVICWICANSLGYMSFDIYPFILLNLAFSIQAAYAAPLILLAQTRQADRDKLIAESDAHHREDLFTASLQRQEIAQTNMEHLLLLLQQNTELTQTTARLSERIETLTAELHAHIMKGD